MSKHQTTDDLIAQFDDHDHINPDAVPAALVKVLEYVTTETGLTGDYNDGQVRLVDGGRTIQWYPRNNNAGSHSGILRWLQQPDQQDVAFSVIKLRGEDLYIEVIPAERAGIDQ